MHNKLHWSIIVVQQKAPYRVGGRLVLRFALVAYNSVTIAVHRAGHHTHFLMYLHLDQT